MATALVALATAAAVGTTMMVTATVVAATALVVAIATVAMSAAAVTVATVVASAIVTATMVASAIATTTATAVVVAPATPAAPAAAVTAARAAARAAAAMTTARAATTVAMVATATVATAIVAWAHRGHMVVQIIVAHTDGASTIGIARRHVAYFHTRSGGNHWGVAIGDGIHVEVRRGHAFQLQVPGLACRGEGLHRVGAGSGGEGGVLSVRAIVEGLGDLDASCARARLLPVNLVLGPGWQRMVQLDDNLVASAGEARTAVVRRSQYVGGVAGARGRGHLIHVAAYGVAVVAIIAAMSAPASATTIATSAAMSITRATMSRAGAGAAIAMVAAAAISATIVATTRDGASHIDHVHIENHHVGGNSVHADHDAVFIGCSGANVEAGSGRTRAPRVGDGSSFCHHSLQVGAVQVVARAGQPCIDHFADTGGVRRGGRRR